MIFNVSAHWDADAKVWWSESDDIPGFVIEAPDYDQLVSEIREFVPELLVLNLPDRKLENYQIRVVTSRMEELRCA